MKKLAILVIFTFGLCATAMLGQEATPVHKEKKHQTEAKSEVKRPAAKLAKANTSKANVAKAKQ